MTSKTQNVYQRAHNVMRKIGVIGKNKRNTAQSYDYRGIEDVLTHLQPLLEEEGLLILPITTALQTVPYKEKGYVTYISIDFTFINIDEPSDRFIVPIRGEGFDSLDKSTGKAYSSAYKIMCFQTFCVPTAEAQDIEKDEPKQTPRAVPPAIKIMDDSQVMSTNGWNRIYAATDKLEVLEANRATFLLAVLKKAGISAPTTFASMPISSGKVILVDLEAQIKSKSDFFAEPNV